MSSYYIPIQYGVMDIVNIRYKRVRAYNELAAVMLAKLWYRPKGIHQSKIVGY